MSLVFKIKTNARVPVPAAPRGDDTALDRALYELGIVNAGLIHDIDPHVWDGAQSRPVEIYCKHSKKPIRATNPPGRAVQNGWGIFDFGTIAGSTDMHIAGSEMPRNVTILATLTRPETAQFGYAFPSRERGGTGGTKATRFTSGTSDQLQFDRIGSGAGNINSVSSIWLPSRTTMAVIAISYKDGATTGASIWNINGTARPEFTHPVQANWSEATPEEICIGGIGRVTAGANDGWKAKIGRTLIAKTSWQHDHPLLLTAAMNVLKGPMYLDIAA